MSRKTISYLKIQLLGLAVGMTAVSGFGADLYSIVGGNEQIPQRLAAEALKLNPPGIPNEVSLNTTVTKISNGTDRR